MLSKPEEAVNVSLGSGGLQLLDLGLLGADEDIESETALALTVQCTVCESIGSKL